ncbi:MAG: sulfatase-like hydrolase/transferase [Lentisphaeria bacterium]|nr:sulfatase-like hydrolase/transferase [Lentisphaeria bacterium]
MTDVPNIIICQCDQLRAFNVGAYGDSVVRTPNIDRLAAAGTRFETAITSNPVCTPARSCLLTGQYSRTCAGMLGNVHQDPPNQKRVRLLSPTLPELLRDGGYRTGLVGKWHLDPQPQLLGFDSALYPKVAHRYYGQTVFDECTKPKIVEGFLEDFLADHVHHFLTDASQKPFFLHYNISPPHQPIGVGHLPPAYTQMYSRDDVELRANTLLDGVPSKDPFWFNIYTSADYYWRHLRKETQDPADIVPDDFDLVDLTRLYYGAITCVDDLIGRMMDCLDELGLAQNTIIVFLSDHGDNLGSHGYFNKNSLIEESIRIPLIIHDPRGCRPVIDTDHVVSIIDVMPTLLELAGLTVPAYVQGRSLAPLVRGGTMALEANMAFIETGPMIGVRTPSHLYGMKYNAQRHCPVEDDFLFYDLVRDPLEQNNLAGRRVQAGVERTLRKMLLEWDRHTPWLKAPEHVPNF